MSATLPPERVAELEKSHGPRQTGGSPIGLDADDPVSILNLVRDRAPSWLAQIDEAIEQLEAAIDDQRALRNRVEAIYHGAKPPTGAERNGNR